MTESLNVLCYDSKSKTPQTNWPFTNYRAPTSLLRPTGASGAGAAGATFRLNAQSPHSLDIALRSSASALRPAVYLYYSLDIALPSSALRPGDALSTSSPALPSASHVAAPAEAPGEARWRAGAPEAIPEHLQEADECGPG
ncbi:hypothetical protein CF326_g5977 [Tilletia indica]|nr:hypothetical protein CF326_g5977 [Tilletia indica]